MPPKWIHFEIVRTNSHHMRLFIPIKRFFLFFSDNRSIDRYIVMLCSTIMLSIYSLDMNNVSHD